jgi:hypothetical protein
VVEHDDVAERQVARAVADRLGVVEAELAVALGDVERLAYSSSVVITRTEAGSDGTIASTASDVGWKYRSPPMNVWAAIARYAASIMAASAVS